jgi:hypothetical protein
VGFWRFEKDQRAYPGQYLIQAFNADGTWKRVYTQDGRVGSAGEGHWTENGGFIEVVWGGRDLLRDKYYWNISDDRNTLYLHKVEREDRVGEQESWSRVHSMP